jgi:hypothetical protein
MAPSPNAADSTATDPPAPTVATRPPFFIVGSDRSGTTMLRLMLDRAADGPAIPPETMFITDFRGVLREGGLDDHDRAREFTRRVWAHPRVQMWGIDGEPAPPPTGLGHVDAFRWAVEQPFLAYMRRDGKSWWADKTPPNIDHVDLLAEVFPGARFVELVRDGRDVALSMQTMPWGDNNAWTCARRWAHCIREGERQRARHEGRMLLVRYEDLVTQPREQLERVSSFLGIDYDDDMLAVEKTDTSKLQHQDWFANLWQGINTSAMDKWRTKMSEHDQRVFLAAAGAELDLHGYDRAGLEPAHVGTWQQRRYELANLARRIVNLVKLRVVTERGRELRYVVSRRLARR